MNAPASRRLPGCRAWCWLALLLVAAGCASRTVQVEIPPRLDLRAATIGMITFDAVPADKLAQAATTRFMAAVQSGQPGVRFIELGPLDQVLKAVGRERADPEAIQLIGRRYKVASVFAGRYEISDAKPRVSVGGDLSTVRASAWVHIDMSARLWDTRDGATVWTNSRNGDWPVASLRLDAGQPVSVRVSDPEERYGEFMRQLVDAVTEDFRASYETRAVAR